MKNSISDGTTIDFTAGAAYSSGDLVLVGKLVCVAVSDVANGAVGTARNEGVFNVPVLGTDVVAQGDSLWFDAGNARLTKTATSNNFAGKAWGASGNGVTTVDVKLGGVGKDVTG